MLKSIRILLITLFLSALMLSACGNSTEAPAEAIEAYWQVFTSKDSAALSGLTCGEYEATALVNLESFQSVELKLKDLNCTTVTSTDVAAEVTCVGALSATYGAEDTDFDLGASTYVVVKEGSDWLMCGEK